MGIRETAYHGVRAIEVDSGKVKATFLPDNGGRFISFIDAEQGREWMASETGETYRGIDLDSVYIDGDVCGMDDMFPTIDPEIAPVEAGVRKGVEYNDHGEVARSAFDCVIDGNKAVFTFESGRLAYRYVKTVYARCGKIKVDYHIENLSDDPFPFLWAGHCMLAAEEGGEVLLPFKKGEEAEICFDEDAEIGTRGTRFTVKPEHLVSRAFSPEGNAYKFYYLNKTPKGLIRYAVNGRAFRMEYDKDLIPYVGVWMNNGKFKGFPCATPEPCTVAFDKVSEAAKRGMFSVIDPRGSFDFTLTLSVETVK